jgi:hypothetical protein
MTTRTCTLDHADLTTRYCGQCGAKLQQPLQDLRAHLVSQLGKARARKNEKSMVKWNSWIDALGTLVNTTKPMPREDVKP